MSSALESSLAAALIFGAVWLGVAAILGPVLGRYMKQNAKRYQASKTESASKR